MLYLLCKRDYYLNTTLHSEVKLILSWQRNIPEVFSFKTKHKQILCTFEKCCHTVRQHFAPSVFCRSCECFLMFYVYLESKNKHSRETVLFCTNLQMLISLYVTVTGHHGGLSTFDLHPSSMVKPQHSTTLKIPNHKHTAVFFNGKQFTVIILLISFKWTTTAHNINHIITRDTCRVAQGFVVAQRYKSYNYTKQNVPLISLSSEMVLVILFFQTIKVFCIVFLRERFHSP